MYQIRLIYLVFLMSVRTVGAVEFPSMSIASPSHAIFYQVLSGRPTELFFSGSATFVDVSGLLLQTLGIMQFNLTSGDTTDLMMRGGWTMTYDKPRHILYEWDGGQELNSWDGSIWTPAATVSVSARAMAVDENTGDLYFCGTGIPTVQARRFSSGIIDPLASWWDLGTNQAPSCTDMVLDQLSRTFWVVGGFDSDFGGSAILYDHIASYSISTQLFSGLGPGVPGCSGMQGCRSMNIVRSDSGTIYTSVVLAGVARIHSWDGFVWTQDVGAFPAVSQSWAFNIFDGIYPVISFLGVGDGTQLYDPSASVWTPLLSTPLYKKIAFLSFSDYVGISGSSRNMLVMYRLCDSPPRICPRPISPAPSTALSSTDVPTVTLLSPPTATTTQLNSPAPFSTSALTATSVSATTVPVTELSALATSLIGVFAALFLLSSVLLVVVLVRQRERRRALRNVEVVTALQAFPPNLQQLGVFRGYAKNGELDKLRDRMPVTGFPEGSRPDVWRCFLGIPSTAMQVEMDEPCEFERQFDADIPRLYSNSITSDMRGKVRRLMRAFFNSHPEYDYWQGFDSVSVTVLRVYPDVEVALPVLEAITVKFYSCGLLFKTCPDGLNDRLQSFAEILATREPALSDSLDSLGISPEMYAVPWFITLFAAAVQFDQVLLVYDVILASEGAHILDILGLELLKLHQQDLSVEFLANLKPKDVQQWLTEAK